MKSLKVGIVGMAALSILCCLLIAAAPASAFDLQGFEKHSGPGWDLYITNAPQVSDEAICLVANFGGNALILTVQELNMSQPIQTVNISPHTSDFIVLVFPDVETQYVIKLVLSGVTVFSTQKERPTYYLPQAQDAGWHIAPPKIVAPKEFSLDDLLAAIANITWQTLAITTLIVAAGVFVGCLIKSVTKFLVPTDILSISFYIIIILDFLWQIIPLQYDRIWLIPLLIGYFLGFIIWHIPYLEPVTIDSESKTLTIQPLVLYFPEDKNKPCIQAQNNRALFKRWIGIHHELGANGPLYPDWSTNAKKPYWPRLKMPGLWIQRTETTQETIRWWIFDLKHFKTTLSLANASKMPYYLWLTTSKSFYELTDRLEWSETKRVKEHLTRRAESTAAAADMLEHSLDVSTHDAIKDIFGRGFGRPEPVELGEHELTVIEEAETEVKAEEVGTEDEAAGKEREDADEEPEEERKEERPKKKSKKKEETERT
jgi:hypothetical protein